MTDRDETPGRSRMGVGTGIALGLILGTAVGLLFIDNLALGAGVGLLIGIVAGAAYDARRSSSDES